MGDTIGGFFCLAKIPLLKSPIGDIIEHCFLLKTLCFMDYIQTNRHYRRREFRQQLGWGVRLLVMGLMFWAGWFWGSGQQSAVLSANTQELIDAIQENERLQLHVTSLKYQLKDEADRRTKAELLINSGAGQDEIGRLNRVIADYLAKGISEEQLKLALQEVVLPSHCRFIEKKDVAVATPFFAGRESNTKLLNDDLHVFVEGIAGQRATTDRPWFNPREPISMRVAVLGGEKIASGPLPLSMNIRVDSWVMRLDLIEASLRGYVTVSVSKCGFN